jgi:hypothetical protein
MFSLAKNRGECAMKKAALGLLAGTALLLAACGNSPGDRAVSGGLLGAGAGAAIGAATGGSAATGAAIGGIGGAVVGATTSPCDLNMGDPWWRDNGGDEAYHRRCDRR